MITTTMIGEKAHLLAVAAGRLASDMAKDGKKTIAMAMSGEERNQDAKKTTTMTTRETRDQVEQPATAERAEEAKAIDAVKMMLDRVMKTDTDERRIGLARRLQVAPHEEGEMMTMTMIADETEPRETTREREGQPNRQDGGMNMKKMTESKIGTEIVIEGNEQMGEEGRQKRKEIPTTRKAKHLVGPQVGMRGKWPLAMKIQKLQKNGHLLDGPRGWWAQAVAAPDLLPLCPPSNWISRI
jgi:hypothetical protein